MACMRASGLELRTPGVPVQILCLHINRQRLQAKNGPVQPPLASAAWPGALIAELRSGWWGYAVHVTACSMHATDQWRGWLALGWQWWAGAALGWQPRCCWCPQPAAGGLASLRELAGGLFAFLDTAWQLLSGGAGDGLLNACGEELALLLKADALLLSGGGGHPGPALLAHGGKPGDWPRGSALDGSQLHRASTGCRQLEQLSACS